MKKNKAFTLHEVIFVIAFATIIAAIGFAGYVAWHFLQKIW